MTSSNNFETIRVEKRGRMRLTVVRKVTRYGPKYSAIVGRRYKSGDKNGEPTFETTHWMDEQDVLNSLRLHEIADDTIAQVKLDDASSDTDEEAA